VNADTILTPTGVCCNLQHEASPAQRVPRMAVVVPSFKHSGLVREAVFSVVSQPQFADVDIVLVDDGCPDPQTYVVLSQFAAAWPNVHYIRQLNRGLSAARNRGIDFVLSRLPEAEAIYLLDADNLLADHALGAMQQALIDYPDSDWFYPDIRMFGIRAFFDYSGSFRTVVASLVNICEAGSLVRRRVFESGVRFDERMKLGYEDWEFWLSSIDKGFRGRHLPSLGLRYRKRAESMLVDSYRYDAQIREYMARKHEAIFQINEFNLLEHQQLPRFALIRPDGDGVLMLTDPALEGSTITRETLETNFWHQLREPTLAYVGGFYIVANSSVLDMLAKVGLLRWTLREIEISLLTKTFFALEIVSSTGEKLELRKAEAGRSAHLIALSHKTLSDVARDEHSHWIEALRNNMGRYNIHMVQLAVPTPYLHSRHLKPTAIGDLIQFCLHLRSHRLRTAPTVTMHDIDFGAPPLSSIIARARTHYGNGVLPPVAASQKGRIGFVVPICDFGGVEKVVFCVAQELRALGFKPSLIVLGAPYIQRLGEAVKAFEDLYILENRTIASSRGRSFVGTNLLSIGTEFRSQDLINLLATFEVVISSHSAEVLELMASVRKCGVITASYLHLFDRTQHGRYVGHPMLALAYEHTLDLVLTCSESLADEMAGLGVPRQKLTQIPNRASFKISEQRWSEINELREMRADGEIRLLYLGRLDRQKGMDRLFQIIMRIGEEPGMELRIIGKAIIKNNESDEIEQFTDYLEDPIYDNDGLSATYAWADVLLLPSRYEGFPLSVIEAMDHGVVPIVADCGAVAEAIDHEVNGFIVKQSQVVEEFATIIGDLKLDRHRLRAMQQAARVKVANWTWRDGVLTMVKKIEALRVRQLLQRTQRRVVD
jgi:glycosyltransferase involved in cell wall biosynthesis